MTTELCHRCGQAPVAWNIDWGLRVCSACRTQTNKEPKRADGEINTYGWHFHRAWKVKFAAQVAIGKMTQEAFDKMFAEIGV